MHGEAAALPLQPSRAGRGPGRDSAVEGRLAWIGHRCCLSTGVFVDQNKPGAKLSSPSRHRPSCVARSATTRAHRLNCSGVCAVGKAPLQGAAVEAAGSTRPKPQRRDVAAVCVGCLQSKPEARRWPAVESDRPRRRSSRALSWTWNSYALMGKRSGELALSDWTRACVWDRVRASRRPRPGAGIDFLRRGVKVVRPPALWCTRSWAAPRPARRLCPGSDLNRAWRLRGRCPEAEGDGRGGGGRSVVFLVGRVMERDPVTTPRMASTWV